jgi:hypothetical protein
VLLSHDESHNSYALLTSKVASSSGFLIPFTGNADFPLTLIPLLSPGWPLPEEVVGDVVLELVSLVGFGVVLAL